MNVSDEMVKRAHAVFRMSSVPAVERDSREALEAALAPYEAPPFVLSDEELEALNHVDNRPVAKNSRSYIMASALRRASLTLRVAQAAPVVGEWSQADVMAAHKAMVQHCGNSPFYISTTRYMLEAVKYRLPPHDHAVCVDGAARGAEEALERAQETIATLEAKLVAPLSDEERGEIEDCRSCHGHGVSVRGEKLDALLRIVESRFPKPTPAVKSPGQVAYETMRELDPTGWAGWEGVESKNDWEQAAAAVLAAHGAKP